MANLEIALGEGPGLETGVEVLVCAHTACCSVVRKRRHLCKSTSFSQSIYSSLWASDCFAIQTTFSLWTSHVSFYLGVHTFNWILQRKALGLLVAWKWASRQLIEASLRWPTHDPHSIPATHADAPKDERLDIRSRASEGKGLRRGTQGCRIKRQS
jgi:hypothetical protein